MAKKFDFGKHFQEGILHFLITNNKFADYCMTKLKPEFFTAEIAGKIFDLLNQYYKKYREIKYHDLINEIKILKTVDKKQKKEYYYYIKKIYMKSTYNYKYTVEKVVDFVKTQIYRETLSDSYDLIEDCRFENVNKNMRELSKLEFDTHEGLSFSKQYWKKNAKRIGKSERKSDKYIPTGINMIDHYIKGARKGELCIWLAGPSVGKSFALIHIAKYAMFLGYNVLYYTLELAEDLIYQRLLMNICNMTTEQTIFKENKLLKRLKKLNKIKSGEIKIRQFARPTVEDLRNHYNYMLHQGFKADLIIVDYMDLIKSLSHKFERHQQLGEIGEELRAMGVDFDVPMWTASGSNRGASNKQVVEMGDEKGSYEKSYLADVIVSISATKEEKTQDEDGHTRVKLYIAKSRSKGNDGKVIGLVQDKHRMQFVVKDKEYITLVNDDDKNKPEKKNK